MKTRPGIWLGDIVFESLLLIVVLRSLLCARLTQYYEECPIMDLAHIFPSTCNISALCYSPTRVERKEIAILAPVSLPPGDLKVEKLQI